MSLVPALRAGRSTTFGSPAVSSAITIQARGYAAPAKPAKKVACTSFFQTIRPCIVERRAECARLQRDFAQMQRVRRSRRRSGMPGCVLHFFYDSRLHNGYTTAKMRSCYPLPAKASPTNQLRQGAVCWREGGRKLPPSESLQRCSRPRHKCVQTISALCSWLLSHEVKRLTIIRSSSDPCRQPH